MSILYASDTSRGAVFAEILASEAPDLAFHIGTAPDPATVEYMITWQAPDLQDFPNLKLLFSTGAGVDQFDLAALPDSAQLVRMLEPGIAEQMREYVTLAVLGLHRDLPTYLNQQRKGQWKFDKNHMAATRRVGVMGLGQLGQSVLQALAPFGFALAGWARSPRQIDGVEVFTDLNAFLARTDILICLLPLTAETEGMLDATLFAGLPEGAMLVQVGRGRQTDQAALLAALDSGQLSAAWLDVTDPEPLPQDHPLWSHPRVILTPHIASRSRPEEGARFVLKAIRAHQNGQPVPGAVDRAKGY